MSAREEILGRVRDALADRPDAPAVERAYRRSLDLGRDELLERFAERVGEYRATVHRVAADGVAGAVARALDQRGAARVVVPPGLSEAWLPEGLEPIVDAGGLSPHELDALDAALTGSAAAIAETGTIVLDGIGASGRRALTLVPDHHVCVVEAEAVVGTVPEAFEALEAAVRDGRPLTFVSGPSATSDIELSRVEGVHGPRVLDVVLAG